MPTYLTTRLFTFNYYQFNWQIYLLDSFHPDMFVQPSVNPNIWGAHGLEGKLPNFFHSTRCSLFGSLPASKSGVHVDGVVSSDDFIDGRLALPHRLSLRHSGCWKWRANELEWLRGTERCVVIVKFPRNIIHSYNKIILDSLNFCCLQLMKAFENSRPEISTEFCQPSAFNTLLWGTDKRSSFADNIQLSDRT